MTVGPRHRKLLLVAAAAAIAAAAVLVPTVGGTPPGDLGHDFPLPEDATIVPDPPRLIGFDPPSGSNDNDAFHQRDGRGRGNRPFLRGRSMNKGAANHSPDRRIR